MQVNLSEGTIAKLELQPGDSLVVKTDNRLLTAQQAGDIIAAVQAVCPGHEVLVLPAGSNLGILRGEIDDKAFGEVEVEA